jgi:hypothetical protein
MAKGIVWDEAKWANMRIKLQKLSAGYPTAAMQTAGQVAVQVINDCIMQGPTVPMKTGNLRSSGTFEVIQGDSWRSVKFYVGFNTPYAAKVHEWPVTKNWTTPGSGPKYLESKLVMYKEQYLKVWTQKMDRILGFTGQIL